MLTFTFYELKLFELEKVLLAPFSHSTPLISIAIKNNVHSTDTNLYTANSLNSFATNNVLQLDYLLNLKINFKITNIYLKNTLCLLQYERISF